MHAVALFGRGCGEYTWCPLGAVSVRLECAVLMLFSKREL